jgi:isochorismate synthase
MSELFRKIKIQFQSKLPFAVYSKPNSDRIIALLQHDDTLQKVTKINSKGFVFTSFDGKKTCLIPKNLSNAIVEKVDETTFFVQKKRKSEIDSTAKLIFENLVNNGIEAIKNQQFEKVVLSRNEIVSIRKFDFETTFFNLIQNYESAFKYCFYHPEIGLWMGATPEQFLKVDNDVIKTVALAGTQLFPEKEDIHWKEKESNEQQIVTDFIVNNLQRYVYNINVSDPFTQRAGNLAHLKSTIEAKMNSVFDIDKIIEALHPTPAVCGLPKEISKKFILENEGYDREFYTGFLGEWNHDFLTWENHKFDLFVNLRCMKIDYDTKIEISKAKIYVGCGITIDSNPEKEFLETVNKAMTMKKVL